MTNSSLPADCLIWDAHSCAPLHPDYDLAKVRRHLDAGASFVSLNIGMDMNPVAQVMQVLASFRAQIAEHPDLFMLATNVAAVDEAKATGRLAIGFDLEGAVPLMERPEMVQTFYDLGVRQIHLAYNRNNSVACGCYDVDGPLTDLGRDIVRAIYAAGMLMDCSHTGRRCSLDIMELGLGPVFFSHANPMSVRTDNRNIDVEQMRKAAETGGVICVNGVGRFLRDPAATTETLIEALEVMIDVVGPAHVGLGIDYEYDDGGLPQLPADVDRRYWWPAAHGYGPNGVRGIKIARPEQLREIGEGLLARGHCLEDVRGIMGLNMRRLASTVWQ